MTEYEILCRLRAAEERAEDAERRAAKAEGALALVRARLISAEAIALDAVSEWCWCNTCAARRTNACVEDA